MIILSESLVKFVLILCWLSTNLVKARYYLWHSSFEDIDKLIEPRTFLIDLISHCILSVHADWGFELQCNSKSLVSFFRQKIWKMLHQFLISKSIATLQPSMFTVMCVNVFWNGNGKKPPWPWPQRIQSKVESQTVMRKKN